MVMSFLFSWYKISLVAIHSMPLPCRSLSVCRSVCTCLSVRLSVSLLLLLFLLSRSLLRESLSLSLILALGTYILLNLSKILSVKEIFLSLPLLSTFLQMLDVSGLALSSWPSVVLAVWCMFSFCISSQLLYDDKPAGSCEFHLLSFSLKEFEGKNKKFYDLAKRLRINPPQKV